MEALFGDMQHHLVEWKGQLFHKDIIQPLQALVQRAEGDGIEAVVVSAFRSYERQLVIWNEKVVGKRKIMTASGQEFTDTEPSQRLKAILRFSAIPGTSRHHWGTDLDIVEKTRPPSQLIPSEAAGTQFRWNAWLTQFLPQFGFFRPYEKDLGGVSPEWWHISHRQVSQQYFSQMTLERFIEVVSRPGLMLQDLLLQDPEDYFQKYFRNIDESRTR